MNIDISVLEELIETKINQNKIQENINSNREEFENYKIQVGINNIFDEKYQQAHEYSTMGRTFNFGIRRVY